MNFTNHKNSTEYISSINANNFDVIALALFRYQYAANQLYKSFVDALHILPQNIHRIEQIPFLPISFFKTHPVISGYENPLEAPLVFESSGTTNITSSKHFVLQPKLYEAAFLNGFEQYYGKSKDYVFLALLPSYLERKNASLVYMARELMNQSNHPQNGFYLNEWSTLALKINSLIAQNKKIFLLGVTYALLDFAEAFPMNLANTIVMETGGMKGRKEEWTRKMVHDLLKEKWNLNQVHSEYGMTELLSQAYALKEGVFYPSTSMKVLVRDINDPLSSALSGSGCLNIIDLANVHSCAFIATEDLGIVHENSNFEVLGRLDNAALRGCSLMYL